MTRDDKISDFSYSTQIMTLSETASYLKISERTVLRMVKKKEIPVTKVAGQWRFMKDVIDDWLITNMQKHAGTSLTTLIERGEVKVSLSRVIKPEYIINELTSGTKKEILTQLVEPLSASGYIAEPESYINSLIRREQMVTTALAGGVAVPHIRNLKDNPLKDPSVALGVCREGAFFDSPDNEKTYLFFLICANSDIVHLKILSAIIRLTHEKQIISSIISAGTNTDIISELIKFDRS